MTISEVATVLAWNDALRATDVETLISLSSDDIEIAEANGAIQGHQALRQWALENHDTWKIGRTYVHHGVVVVELTNDVTGEVAAAVFRVLRDQVTAVFRHPDLASALAATELIQDDQVND